MEKKGKSFCCQVGVIVVYPIQIQIAYTLIRIITSNVFIFSSLLLSDNVHKNGLICPQNVFYYVMLLLLAVFGFVTSS